MHKITVPKEKNGKKAFGKKIKITDKKIPKAAKTVQDTIPYETVFPDGIIKIQPSMYSKTYPLQDTNFKTENDEVQEGMFKDYEKLLNSINGTMEAEVTIFNRSIDEGAFRNSVLLKPEKDSLNKYREELNNILSSKMMQGRNNLSKEKYFTVSVMADDIEDAQNTFRRLDSEVAAKIGKINKTPVTPLSIEERLNILYDIYNPDETLTFKNKIQQVCNNIGSIDWKALNRAGITSKDIVAPSSMLFTPKYFMLGDIYGRSFFLDNLPTFLSTEILTAISDLSCNMLTSIHYKPYQPDEAVKMIRAKSTNIDMNVQNYQKRASKNGYSPDIMPSELKRAKEEAGLLIDDVMSRNQKIFKTTITITIFARSLEELESLSASLKSIGVSNLCQVKALDWQQEIGLNTSLPLGNCGLGIDRILTTESASVFMPFSVKELYQKGGKYYGQNIESKNLIIYDRSSAKNYNGLIFGKPGSGKSFIAKEEMLFTLLGSPTDVVYVIDPESEYLPLAMALGGERIRIALGSDTHINPLDMDLDYARNDSGEDDPVTMKCDFLVTLCESALKARYGLSPIETNIIHRCGRKIYAPYLKHMQSIAGTGITYDPEAMPTLSDLYEQLRREPEAEAQRLAMGLEIYCVGNYDLFSHRTNVNTKSRFVVYDIKDIGAGMKDMAMQICLNNIWNKIIENGKKGIRTWFYMDEFYLLVRTESSAKFLQEIYKRARKWKGIPTGITQNVGDLLTSTESQTIVQNCDFLLMMNQSQIDRMELADMYNISPSLLEHITEAPAGTGLLYNGSTIIPIKNEFPENTELYKLFDTKDMGKNKDTAAAAAV